MTSTRSYTPTWTSTYTHTKTFTPTQTLTSTFSPTITHTPTITLTPTITYTPTITFTPTQTPVYADIFYVDHNYFNPAQGPVSIKINSTMFPGNYSLIIYNSAGEKVRTLVSPRYQNGPVFEWYTWDGKNDFNEMCASGVYMIYANESFEYKFRRVLLVK